VISTSAALWTRRESHKKGEPKSLLSCQARISRQLERWLDRVAGTIDRQSAPPRTGPTSEEDLRGELEWIALGHDPKSTAHDRILANTALSKLSPTVAPPEALNIRIVSGPDGRPAVEYLDFGDADDTLG